MNASDSWPTTRVTLLARIRDAGDDAAWRAFVDLYAPLVYGYCRNRDLQHADSQNVTQEVFCRVSQAILSFEYDATRGRFRGWLGLITHQQVLRYRQNQLRNGRGTGNEALTDSFAGEAEGAWIEAFNAHVYAEALENIRPEFDRKSWGAFERVWDGRERPGDVASDLGESPQWIYQLKHKIIARLKEEIERMTADVAIFNRP